MQIKETYTFDYYPFGMLMPGRSYSSTAYKYGFNGKENDNEVKGVGSQQDYGMRIYDPRIGRFLSPDPLIINEKEYPELSTYQFASNTPIQAIDIDGLEAGTKICLDDNKVSQMGGGPSSGGTSFSRPPASFNRATPVGNVRPAPPANTPGQVRTVPVNQTQTQIQLNQAQGKLAETKVFNELKAENPNTYKNITSRPVGADKSSNSTNDIFQKLEGKEFGATEVKTGKAKLSTGQAENKLAVERDGKLEIRTDKLRELGIRKGDIVSVKFYNVRYVSVPTE